MKLIAVLSWYNESPTWLAATVASLSRIGVDHLIAVDGAYATYPDGRARSPFTEVEAITLAAESVDIGVTIERPSTRWQGGEPEKRTRMFEIARSIGTIDEDWVFAIDADEVVTNGNPRVREELEASECDSAYARLEQWWPDVQADDKRAEVARMFEHPTILQEKQTRFFRLMENLRVHQTHYTYVGDRAGVGYTLRGDNAGKRMGFTQGPIQTLERTVCIEHRDPLRDASRRAEKKQYYQHRDALGLEVILDAVATTGG